MRVWVICNRVYEKTVGAYSTEEKAQTVMSRLYDELIAAGYSGADACTYYEYDEFEIDAEPVSSHRKR